MAWQDHIIDPATLWGSDSREFGPIALIDLSVRCAPVIAPVLPACPVIGFGGTDHPLAPLLDAVVETPVGIAMLVERIVGSRHAAAVTCDLLRILPGLDRQAGLIAESLAYGVLQGSREHAEWLDGAQRIATTSPGRLVAVRHDARLELMLDRPGSGNTIDRALRDQLDAVFAMAALDDGITAIRLTGRGRTFCLGADLAEFGTTRDAATAHAIRRRTLPARGIACCADRLEVHVTGGCVGAGLEMAAWARRLTATPNAWFQLPELAMGLLPGAGGCVALTRRIGRQRTALLALSGKRISARVALAWGLIDAILEDDIVDHDPPRPPALSRQAAS